MDGRFLVNRDERMIFGYLIAAEGRFLDNYRDGSVMFELLISAELRFSYPVFRELNLR